MSEYRSDPARFERCSQPHDNAETLNAELEAFVNGVSALREKHRMTNVVCIMEASYRDEEGVPVAGQTSLQLGDNLHHEIMVARALGKIQGDRQRLISDALNQAMREVKAK